MGLFDEVVGSFLNGDAGKYQAILNWVNEQGGIQALLQKLQNGGLGDILSTWISNQHSNQPVSGSQLESALGTPAVSDLGQKLGMIPVLRRICWRNICRKSLMRSRRREKLPRRRITIYSAQGWIC